MNKVSFIILVVAAVIGFLAMMLSIIGVATVNWVDVHGNTHELQKKFNQLTDPNGTFIQSLSANLTGIPQEDVILVAKQTLEQVDRQLSGNLQRTAYSLFDKVTQNAATKVVEFKLPQGLIITGLICLFIGIALVIIATLRTLNRLLVFRVIPLVFFVLGSIFILLGCLFFTKIIIEDFGHELGIKAELGSSFVLVVLSSIFGFITAVIAASAWMSHRNRADSVAKDERMITSGPVLMVRKESNNEKANNYANDDGF